MKTSSTLVLASASPQRRDLLAAAKVLFEVRPADVDETPLPDESPRDHVLRMAVRKAREVSRNFPDCYVLGADTVIDLDGRILGKPEGPTDAEKMLFSLSGRSHQVLTGVCIRLPGGWEIVEAVSSEVVFRNLAPEEIKKYVATGEPLNKAGAYAVQGKGRTLIARVEGSFSNVVGLPMEWVIRTLETIGKETK